MTTPLIILGILLLPWGAAQVLVWTGRPVDRRIGGVIGLSIAFVFFGAGHFVQTQPMTEMLPPWIPYRVAIIYLTGIFEWALAVGLLFPRTRRASGYACISILVLFFPANIYAAVNSIGMGGHLWGPMYLLIRGPLQILLVGWAYWFTVREIPGERARSYP
ncbi:MAG: hypothetical protein PVH89_07830 [Gammaproteobacteria bacterium]|jgi:uncharacterized membrane protein